MTMMKKCFAFGAAVAVAVVSQFAVAQNEIDDLLKDIEGEPAAPAVPAAPAESVAEQPAAAAPAAAPAEAAAEQPQAAEPEAEAAPAGAEAAPAPDPADDAELLANIRTTEKLRREALDVQAQREIGEARASMNEKEYDEAVRHYELALKLLNDRPSSKDFRKECNQGIAEGLYRAALQENDVGRREQAVKLMQKAVDKRHPKARRVLERWVAEDTDAGSAAVVSEAGHRLNDEEFKQSRVQIQRHLRRSRQFLAVRDMKRALEECEIVLVNDPYNQDAQRIRRAIQRKRAVILEQERDTARAGMIADVDEVWRPVYAVNAAALRDSDVETVKKQVGEDPERTIEQDIERRMKEMKLPTISFKPPATIIEAVEFFRTASRDYDRPDIPAEERGFNFVLKAPVKQQAAAVDASDDFTSNGAEDSAEQGSNGLPPIPTINASNLPFYEALGLVCDSVGYKFIIRGRVVMVMPKDASTAEMISRKYDVLDAFLERMTSASADVKEMKSAGFGGGSSSSRNDEGEENQEKDWKGFFEQMGVKWPEGSSIMYIKTLGKLYVRNTRENLAEFEKVLQELGSRPKLIEIETRFVEVKQEDLNSLGFEWILNSDYSLNVGEKLGKALGINNGVWGERDSGYRETALDSNLSRSINGRSGGFAGGGDGWLNETVTQGGKPSTTAGSRTSDIGNNSGVMSVIDKSSRKTYPYGSQNASWLRGDNDTGRRNIGINAFGGTSSEYNRGNRYLSDVGNHVSGSDASHNDQFMRVNAFLGAADLSMILHMLSQRSDTDLLSAPKVVTKSGENAVIKVVIEYIYPQDYDVQLQSSGSSSGSSGGSSQSAILAVVEPQNFTMREVGVILDVTPTYSEQNGGTIDLELKPQVVDEPTWKNYGMRIPFTGNTSSGNIVDLGGIITAMTGALNSLGEDLLGSEQKTDIASRVVDSSMNAIDSLSNAGQQNMTWYDAPMEQPFFPVRSIDSKVSITPGSTVVMGGLITEARKAMDDKIPFLGDLPFVGRLFRSHAEQTIKKNLLIFVTGRLITPSGREISVNDETIEVPSEVKPAPTAE